MPFDARCPISAHSILLRDLKSREPGAEFEQSPTMHWEPATWHSVVCTVPYPWSWGPRTQRGPVRCPGTKGSGQAHGKATTGLAPVSTRQLQGTPAIVGPPFASRAEQGRLPLEDAAPRPVWKLVRAANAQGDGLRLCLDTAQELTQHLQVFFRFLGVGHVRAVLE